MTKLGQIQTLRNRQIAIFQYKKNKCHTKAIKINDKEESKNPTKTANKQEKKQN